jgi:hypothetical protein
MMEMTESELTVSVDLEETGFRQGFIQGFMAGMVSESPVDVPETE